MNWIYLCTERNLCFRKCTVFQLKPSYRKQHMFWKFCGFQIEIVSFEISYGNCVLSGVIRKNSFLLRSFPNFPHKVECKWKTKKKCRHFGKKQKIKLLSVPRNCREKCLNYTIRRLKNYVRRRKNSGDWWFAETNVFIVCNRSEFQLKSSQKTVPTLN